MRVKIFSLFLIIGMLIISPAQAQDTICNPDLAQVTALLADAQAAFESGDTAGAINLMTDARNTLALQEANCLNYALETVGDKRSNPVPLGQRMGFELSDGGRASMEIDNFIDNADEFASFEIKDGKRLIAVELTYYCEQSPDQQCAVLPSSFTLVGNLSTEYTPEIRTSLLNHNSFNLYGGGQGVLKVAFVVGVSETDFIVRRSSLNPMVPHTYFATS